MKDTVMVNTESGGGTDGEGGFDAIHCYTVYTYDYPLTYVGLADSPQKAWVEVLKLFSIDAANPLFLHEALNTDVLDKVYIATEVFFNNTYETFVSVRIRRDAAAAPEKRFSTDIAVIPINMHAVVASGKGQLVVNIVAPVWPKSMAGGTTESLIKSTWNTNSSSYALDAFSKGTDDDDWGVDRTNYPERYVCMGVPHCATHVSCFKFTPIGLHRHLTLAPYTKIPDRRFPMKCCFVGKTLRHLDVAVAMGLGATIHLRQNNIPIGRTTHGVTYGHYVVLAKPQLTHRRTEDPPLRIVTYPPRAHNTAEGIYRLNAAMAHYLVPRPQHPTRKRPASTELARDTTRQPASSTDFAEFRGAVVDCSAGRGTPIASLRNNLDCSAYELARKMNAALGTPMWRVDVPCTAPQRCAACVASGAGSCSACTVRESVQRRFLIAPAEDIQHTLAQKKPKFGSLCIHEFLVGPRHAFMDIDLTVTPTEGAVQIWDEQYRKQMVAAAKACYNKAHFNLFKTDIGGGWIAFDASGTIGAEYKLSYHLTNRKALYTDPNSLRRIHSEMVRITHAPRSPASYRAYLVHGQHFVVDAAPYNSTMSLRAPFAASLSGQRQLRYSEASTDATLATQLEKKAGGATPQEKMTRLVQMRFTYGLVQGEFLSAAPVDTAVYTGGLVKQEARQLHPTALHSLLAFIAAEIGHCYKVSLTTANLQPNVYKNYMFINLKDIVLKCVSCKKQHKSKTNLYFLLKKGNDHDYTLSQRCFKKNTKTKSKKGKKADYMYIVCKIPRQVIHSLIYNTFI